MSPVERLEPARPRLWFQKLGVERRTDRPDSLLCGPFVEVVSVTHSFSEDYGLHRGPDVVVDDPSSIFSTVLGRVPKTTLGLLSPWLSLNVDPV